MAFRDSAITSGNSTDIVATMPTAVAGDRLLAFVARDVYGQSISAPTGWEATALVNLNPTNPDGHTFKVFEKKSATGSEGSTQTFPSSGTNRWMAIIVSLSGRDSSAAVTFATATSNTSANSTPISISGSSGTAAAGDDVVAFVGLDTTVSSDTWGESSWSSSLVEQEDGNYTWSHISCATRDNVSSGAFGTVSVTSTRASGSGQAGWALAVIAVPQAASSGQSLTPSLVTNTQTFYAPTLGRGAVTLAPSLTTNAQTFYASTVSVGYELAPSLATNTQVFYGPVVAAGAVTLTPSLVVNGQTFYALIVSSGSGPQELQPSLVANAQTFYGATVVASYGLSPALFTDEQTFSAATVTTQNTLAPELVTNTSVFYTVAATTGAVNLQPTLVTNGQTFYAPAVLQQTNIELFPGLLANEQIFLGPVIAFAQQAQTQFGGWFASTAVSPRTREDREEERRRLGILPSVEIPVTTAEVRELTHEDRQRARRMADKLLKRFAPEPAAPVAVVALQAPDEQPTIGPIELPMEVQATLVAAQKQRAFEQDLVYIVATLVS